MSGGRLNEHAEAINTLVECVNELKDGQRRTNGNLASIAEHDAATEAAVAERLRVIERSIEGIAAELGTHNRQIGDLQMQLSWLQHGQRRTTDVADPTQHRYAIVSAGHVGTLEEIVRDHIRAGGIAFGEDGCHQAMVRP